MTAEQKQAKLAEIDAKSEELRGLIHQRTEAAQKLNAENRVLIEERRKVLAARTALEKVPVEAPVDAEN
jgi:hypothetical protein